MRVEEGVADLEFLVDEGIAHGINIVFFIVRHSANSLGSCVS